MECHLDVERGTLRFARPYTLGLRRVEAVLFLILREGEMTKRGGDTDGDRGGDARKAPNRRGAAADSEFVNLEVDKAHKPALRAYCTTHDELDEAVADILADGTKLTQKYDERNRCYVVFGFATDDSDNAGLILTGRGGSPSRALRELAYKHHALLEGQWANYHNIARDDGDDEW